LVESNELTPIFKQLGLSSYESKIWQALLEKGEADAQQLVRLASVPFGRVYDVLSNLEEKGIIEVQETRPKLYRPRRIGTVIDKLLRARNAEMDTERRTLEEAAEAVKRRFTTLGRTPAKDEVFVSVALGEQDIGNLLKEQMYSVERELLIVIGQVEIPSSVTDLVREAFQRWMDAASRGISVKVMLSSPIPASVELSNSTLKKARGRIEVRLYPGSLNHFKVIDRRYVMFEIVDPHEPEARVALVQLLSRKLAEHMVQIFDRCWRNSRPLDAKLQSYLNVPRTKNHRS